MQALSGLHAMTSLSGGELTGPGFSYGDHVGGYYAALATLAALHERTTARRGSHHRPRAGRGHDHADVDRHPRLSAERAAVRGVGQRAVRVARRRPASTAAATTRCAISVRTSEEWCGLTATMGARAGEGRPLLRSGRRAAHRGPRSGRHRLDAGDAPATRWCGAQDAGVPCTSLSTAVELLADERLRNHGYYEAEDHPELGRRSLQMGGIRSELGPWMRRAAPSSARRTTTSTASCSGCRPSSSGPWPTRR